MRLLFATGSPRNYMAPPRLADEQVNCGPDWKIEKADGRVISLQTPVGAYDLAAIVAQLPPEQRPDAVVCLVDASRRNLPGNLAAIRCPKVLLLADTHHMQAPLSTMVAYANRESYDRVVVLYDRHHFEILRAAGVRNLFWFPGLTFPHADDVVRAARHTSRDRTIAFVGQRGRYHPRRSRLLDALEGARLPVEVRPVQQCEAPGVYGRSLIGFNASLNGDLNLRAFEILSCGSVLLTDELAPDSGMADLWTAGREIVTYGSPDELVERARQLVDQPDEARRIGEAGQVWFDTHFSSAVREKAFSALLHDGVQPPQFGVTSIRTFPAPRQGWPELGATVAAYEIVQELHRIQETVTVCMGRDVAPALAWACGTLPRIRVTEPLSTDTQETDLLVLRPSEVATTSFRGTKYAFVVGGTGTVDDSLFVHGLVRLDPACPIFGRSGNEAAAIARRAGDLLALGSYAAAMQCAQWLLQHDPASIDGNLVMAELALEMGKRDLCLRLLSVVRQKAAGDPRLVGLSRELAKPIYTPKLPERLLRAATDALGTGDWERSVTAARAAVAANPRLAHAHAVLGRALLSAGKPNEAIPALERALSENPNDETLRAMVAKARASTTDSALPTS